MQTIKAAYRRKAKEFHPDVCKDPDAEKKFKAVLEAFNFLSGKKTSRSTCRSYDPKTKTAPPKNQTTQDRKNVYFLKYSFGPPPGKRNPRSRSVIATLELTDDERREGVRGILIYYDEDNRINKFEVRLPKDVPIGYTFSVRDTYIEVGRIPGFVRITIIPKK